MDQQKELSKEEIAKRRDEITAFYKEAIKHLKIQKEYEELLRDIEMARAQKLQTQIELANFYASQNPSKEAKEDFEKHASNLEPDLPGAEQ